MYYNLFSYMFGLKFWFKRFLKVLHFFWLVCLNNFILPVIKENYRNLHFIHPGWDDIEKAGRDEGIQSDGRRINPQRRFRDRHQLTQIIEVQFFVLFCHSSAFPSTEIVGFCIYCSILTPGPIQSPSNSRV